MPNKEGLLNQLKDLVNEIGDGCCSQNGNGNGNGGCCPAPMCCEQPFAQVCFTCPPCIPLPTAPCPVKPLQLPCVKCGPTPEQIIAVERENMTSRYDNFYNNYNTDYRCQAIVNTDNGCPNPSCPPKKQYGVTVDGKSPCCEDYMAKKKNVDCCQGCPTGFKPCSIQLSPPQCCNPIGTWGARIIPCASKPAKREVSTLLPPPECCTRPGCKHWKPEGGPCLYDEPCKAHCFNHPPGMKPSGRYP